MLKVVLQVITSNLKIQSRIAYVQCIQGALSGCFHRTLVTCGVSHGPQSGYI